MNRRNVSRLAALAGVLLAVCFGATALAAPATQRGAGARGPGGGQAIEHVRQTLDSLGLSDDQKKQTDQILQEAQEDIAATAKDLKALSPQERREKLQPILKETLEKLRGVLTDDQQAKLREKMRERRQERQADGTDKKQPNAEVLPSTRPNAPAGAAARGPLLERLRERLVKLDLSPEQQTKIDAVLDDTARKVQALRQSAADNVSDTRDKARLLMQSTRQQILSILTPEQQQKWRDEQPGATPAESPKTDGMGNTTPDTTAAKAAAASSASPATKPSEAKALYEGAPAPPFRLKRLGGSECTLDSFSGKPLVLIFGSFTSPTFRDKIGQVDALSKRYKGRASVLIVYTREAYPANQWEPQRNTDEQIKIEQHKSLAEREKLARLAQQSLKIDTDIALDDVDDATTDAYDAMPNGAYVIANGKIVARQKWADPLGLPAYIDAAMKKSK